MSEGSGFTSMAGARAEGDAPEIGVGMLGYAFMGKAHSHAMLNIAHMMYPPPAVPKLVGIAGRDEQAVAEAARRYGYDGYYTDWRAMLDNDDIQLFDNGGPNDTHADPCILAAERGKHILCEKPLARTADEAQSMVEAVQKAGVKNMVAFNYRFVPAIRQIRKLVDSGLLGQIYHFRAVYLQEWVMAHYDLPMIWRLQKSVAGSGALGDLGAHIIDLGRYLVGEIKSVSGMTRTFIDERPWDDGSMGKVDVDDAFTALLEFDNGAIGTVEASRFAAGRKNGQRLEINAEKASIVFNLERLNELEIFWVGDEPAEAQGFRNVLVSEPFHPWWENWWPQGHMIGWEHTFVHEITHLLDCIVNDGDVAPIGADFVDGYRNAVICDAILESAASGRHVDCVYAA
ncbi:MAG: Gfo/Idh/MocA family oxidoreductase [Caldilineaceae bacterium]|uniref:Gfo/Idh/MocA family oxidoreductase n=1 Tax=Caldilineaceae bacterium SB0661_bin_32 TaxID=2605255 RepID=A0A6B1D7Y8_9CHLR|nr:Gfo/Idh/MocA family oxidoreductase [Caldilineaceae bacterium]MDE0632667.1 Gfo/Idh/MocA family oxidoreductase [Caldilineaceae bacterium]MXZ22957.1 Gfo/Idh/MocA family oxidoreductase [Caldilineaceae bacterium SB0665_bin_25]MYC95659.1 Gfo/Idh/MocA family oxidoreductase [Caldilineaceae bacterium SB0661_bin_32]